MTRSLHTLALGTAVRLLRAGRRIRVRPFIPPARDADAPAPDDRPSAPAAGNHIPAAR